MNNPSKPDETMIGLAFLASLVLFLGALLIVGKGCTDHYPRDAYRQMLEQQQEIGK